jgi:hypothetical protein
MLRAREPIECHPRDAMCGRVNETAHRRRGRGRSLDPVAFGRLWAYYHIENMKSTWIAERQVIFIHGDGHRVPGRIAIASPVRITSDEARCLVALDGVQVHPVPIAGSCTLQALLLAMQYLGMRMYDFCSKGGESLMRRVDLMCRWRHTLGLRFDIRQRRRWRCPMRGCLAAGWRIEVDVARRANEMAEPSRF